MKALKLLRRILKHKFYVCKYCFKAGLYWQGITHDLSKFSWIELKGAYKYWHDEKSSLANERELNGYSKTFLHHKGRNPHHYEYWIYNLDNGGTPAIIPRKYALELACDYLAACKTYYNNPRNEIDWWNDNKSKLKIHEDTKSYLTNIFQKYHDTGDFVESVKFANKFYINE